MYDILRRLAQIADTLDQEGLEEEASSLDEAIIDLGTQAAPAEQVSPEGVEINAVNDRVSDLVDATVRRLLSEGHSIQELAGTNLLSDEMTTVLQEAQANIGV